jgi:hypothetical protein
VIDLLLVNGRILTQDPSRPVARSAACRGGLVESLDGTPPASRVLDLGGRTVVPGFIDAHAHLREIGRKLRGLPIEGAATAAELAGRIAGRAASAAPGEWIRGWGHEVPFDADALGDLDAAAPRNPVWLVRKDGHSGLANSRAMEQAGARAPGGRFVEDEMLRVEAAAPSGTAAEDLLAAQKEALRMGITGVHDARVDDETLQALQGLEQGRSLRLRVHAMYWNPDPSRIEALISRRSPFTASGGFGEGGRLSLRAVKMFLDGSLGSGTCWMLRPGRGGPVAKPEDVERVARVARERGWQMAVHAIGDRANRELLSIYERVAPPPDARWRIEHAQHVCVEDLPRFAPWIASIQPAHAVSDRSMALARLSDAELRGSYAWTAFPRRALGSDAPVDRFDPRWTFACAVGRPGWPSGGALDPESALRGMTAGAAAAGFMEGGVIAPGRPADFAVLSCDWTREGADAVVGSSVLATIMDGRIACRTPGML